MNTTTKIRALTARYTAARDTVTVHADALNAAMRGIVTPRTVTGPAFEEYVAACRAARERAGISDDAARLASRALESARADLARALRAAGLSGSDAAICDVWTRAA